MAQTFLLYARGFVGSVKHATESMQGNRSKPLLSVFDLSPEVVKHVVVNEQIVVAYNQLARRQLNMLDFDWRERVIRASMQAFGTQNLKEWVLACEQSPTFSQTHADCIADWISYCMTGKRKLPPMTWERLIQAGANDPSSPARVCRDCLGLLDKGFYEPLHGTTRNGATVADIATCALSRPGGFSDFLTTMYVFFGEPFNAG